MMKNVSFTEVVLAILILMVLVGVPLVKGCSDGPQAVRILKTQGYTDIETHGWNASCGETQCTGFSAKGPTGEFVEGAVGCGYFFKACTIRIEP